MNKIFKSKKNKIYPMSVSIKKQKINLCNCTINHYNKYCRFCNIYNNKHNYLYFT